jgi:hypothetical protein
MSQPPKDQEYKSYILLLWPTEVFITLDYPTAEKGAA